MDFEKAFDCVSRKKLMMKLSKLGCPSEILAVLCDIYKETQIQVKLGDSLTRKIKQTRGVPQGDRLSPLLFSIFIADLSNYLEKAHCTVTFYADDLALGSKDPQKLQNGINKLSLYCDDNDISVNIEKTVVQVFQNAGRNRRVRDISSPAIWATKISAHYGDNNVAQMSRQICSHTLSAINTGAKRSGETCHMAMPQCC